MKFTKVWKACNRQKRFGSSNLPHSATTGCPPRQPFSFPPPKKKFNPWKPIQNITPIKSILIRFTPIFYLF
nr:MAG TPA: hypothetical protein [Caudoviricetes sp.]